MSLISCPECNASVSAQAVACPHCGYPIRKPTERTFRGPPVDCASCGGKLRKGADAPTQGSGCIVVILGLVLTPILIGIPVLLYGLHLMGKREGYWQCTRCGAKAPRRIKWYELA